MASWDNKTNDDNELTTRAWNEDLPDPDYSHLDLSSFDESSNEDMIEFDNNNNDNGPTSASAAAQNSSSGSSLHPPISLSLSEDDEIDNARYSPVKGQSSAKYGYDNAFRDAAEEEDEDYILGTLIVRVVAARDLTPVPDSSGGSALGKLFSSSKRRNDNVNPYASVRFGQTTQRTSQEFRTTDPTWPRGESMFMDVTHPAKRTKGDKCIAAHPGDPPQKGSPKVESSDSGAGRFSDTNTSNESADEDDSIPQPPPPILTVAIFHTSDSGSRQQQRHNPSKKAAGQSGDSDDVFLGMTAIDLTTLLTGKERSIDAWLPLQGGPLQKQQRQVNNHNDSNNNPWTSGSVRVVCEYESSDTPPKAGDMVRFTGYCNASDLYPLHHHTLYRVVEHDEHGGSNNNNNVPSHYSSDQEDYVTISYTTPEGWFCSVVTHRFMLICEERHHGALELYQDEIVSLGQRLSRSPLVHTLQDSVARIPDEGLVSLGVSVFQGAGSLFQRWASGGVERAVQDLVHATNMDGHNDPSAEESLATDTSDEFFEAVESEDEEEAYDSNSTVWSDRKPAAVDNTHSNGERPARGGGGRWEPLPNMPACPITGEPMVDPVVAADGHTYERTAIARWLNTSDKSPLTGSVLPHKNLVPNYMLLSSLQEDVKPEPASDSAVAAAPSTSFDNDAPQLNRVSSVPDDLEEQAL